MNHKEKLYKNKNQKRKKENKKTWNLQGLPERTSKGTSRSSTKTSS
jgi:hypothetical protein